MRRKKSKKSRIIKGLVILAVLTALSVWGMIKTSWEKNRSGYTNFTGELLEGDDDISYGGILWDLDKNQEYRIEANGVITQGEVTVTYYLDEQLLYEETFTVGKYTCEPLEISGQEGELKIWYTFFTEDTLGTAYHTVYTRCRNWYKLYRRIYENFFAGSELSDRIVRNYQFCRLAANSVICIDFFKEAVMFFI